MKMYFKTVVLNQGHTVNKGAAKHYNFPVKFLPISRVVAKKVK